MGTRRIDSNLAAAIKAEYIKGNTDIDALAEKYEVKASTLRARIYREKWDEPSEDEIVDALKSLPKAELVTKAPDFPDVEDIVDSVEGLKRLDRQLQKQAFRILNLADRHLHSETNLRDLQQILDINIAIRNAYFNSKNANVVINNNTAISNTGLSFFASVQKDEI